MGTGAVGYNLTPAPGPSTEVPFPALCWLRRGYFDLFGLNSVNAVPHGRREEAGWGCPRLPLRRRWRSAAAARWLRAVWRDTAGHGGTRRDPLQGHPHTTPGHLDSLNPLSAWRGLRFLRCTVRSSHWVTIGDRAEGMSPGVGASPIPAGGRWVMGHSSQSLP